MQSLVCRVVDRWHELNRILRITDCRYVLHRSSLRWPSLSYCSWKGAKARSKQSLRRWCVFSETPWIVNAALIHSWMKIHWHQMYDSLSLCTGFAAHNYCKLEAMDTLPILQFYVCASSFAGNTRVQFNIVDINYYNSYIYYTNAISKRVAHQQHLQICHTKYIWASLYASIMGGLATSPSIPSFPNPCNVLQSIYLKVTNTNRRWDNNQVTQ